MKNEAGIKMATYTELGCHGDISAQCGLDQTVLLLKHRYLNLASEK